MFDLPDAPRPVPDTPAPPRFLPEYDNALLSHKDRSHVIPEAVVGCALTGYVGTFMVDGFLRGQWRIVTERSQATIEVDAFAPLTDADEAEVATEAEALLRWHSPRAADVQGPARAADARVPTVAVAPRTISSAA